MSNLKTFGQIATEVGALVTEKNRAYGSSFSTVGEAMRLLYPQGIAPQQMENALLLTRIWDKMMRIATDRTALGEDPFRDLIGYGILGVYMHQQEGQEAPCVSVSESAAEERSAAANDFAAGNAPTPTTQVASERNVKHSKRRSRSNSERSSASKVGARARAVTASARKSSAVRATGRSRKAK